MFCEAYSQSLKESIINDFENGYLKNVIDLTSGSEFDFQIKKLPNDEIWEMYFYRLKSLIWLDSLEEARELVHRLDGMQASAIPEPKKEFAIGELWIGLLDRSISKQNALKALERLSNDPNQKLEQNYCIIKYLLGRTKLGLGKYEEATGEFRHGLQLAAQVENGEYVLKTNSLYQLGRTWVYLKNYDSALYYLNIAKRELTKGLSNAEALNSKINLELGWIHNSQGRFRLAKNSYSRVQDYYLKHKPSAWDEASLNYRLGTLQTKFNPELAKGYYNEVLDYFESLQSLTDREKIMQGTTIASLGLILSDEGNNDAAVDLLKDAILIYSSLGYEPANYLAGVYMNLGRIYSKKRDYFNSSRCYTKTFNYISQLSNKESSILINPLYLIGESYFNFSNFDSSQKYFEETIRIADNQGAEMDINVLRALIKLSQQHTFTNEFSEAEKAITRAKDFIRTYEKLHNRSENKSLNEIEQYLSSELFLVDARLWYRSYVAEKEIYKLSNSLNSYLDYINQVSHSQSFFGEEGKKFQFLDSISSAHNEAIEIAYLLKVRSSSLSSFKSYFSIVEKKKSNVLLSNLNSLEKFETDILAKEKEILEKLKGIIAENKELINLYSSTKDSLLAEQAKRKRFQAQKSYDSLKYALEEANPAFARSKYNSKVISLDELQTTLSPSETLLEYFRTDTALYAFAINREDFSFQKLDLSENFDPELDQFLVNSKSPPKNKTAFKEYYAAKAHELYQTLVEPLLESLKTIPHEGTSQLIIVPDGKLGYLPWDALLTEMPSDVHDYRNYPLLLKKFSIRQAYSATLMKLLEDKETEEKALMAAFAPAYMNKSTLAQVFKSTGGETCGPPDEEKFEELSQSSQELDEILEHMKGVRFDTLNASEARFKEIADNYRILHLTMHGFTDDCDPMYSGLAFTPRTMLEAAGISDTTNPTNEGVLHAYEIYNMRLNAELIVMSACQTGLGKIQAGEGIMSLARAFAHAGSPNTVMSLWQVQESSTRKLMGSFYEYLDGGNGKDEALRLAKLDFINGNGIAHPFYWAGFTLIGDDKPIVEDNWFEKNWWMLAIGFFLLLVIYAVLRRYSSQKKVL